MSKPRQCANCTAPLPPDHPADNHYCAECTAKWQRAPATQNWADAAEDDATQTVPGQCPNCKAPLPPDHPADNPYCARCSAHWWAGRAAREQRGGSPRTGHARARSPDGLQFASLSLSVRPNRLRLSSHNEPASMPPVPRRDAPPGSNLGGGFFAFTRS
jgi:hypothetical protein